MEREAISPRARTVEFTIRVRPIAVILAAGLLLRLFLASLPGFGVDMGSFQAWSIQLAADGPWNFYKTDFFADYTPGYLYILWFIGGLNRVFTLDGGQFQYLLKLPAIAADLASAYLLYRMLAGRKAALQLAAPTIYLFLPAILLIGPVWGQADSLLAFFLLLTVYYFARGRLILASIAYVIGFLIKPQAVAALPIFAFWLLRKYNPGAWFQSAAAALAAGIFIILPFFPRNPWGLFEQLENAANVENYRVTSFWAYNFWGLFGLFKPDDITFVGIPYRIWGFLLFAMASLAIVSVFGRARTPGTMALAVALSVMAFFVFLTRMHERYLFPFFLPFLAASVIFNSRLLWTVFVGLSVIHFFNLFHVYSYPLYNPSGPLAEPLYFWIEDRVFAFSLMTFLAFPLLLLASHFLIQRKRRLPRLA